MSDAQNDMVERVSRDALRLKELFADRTVSARVASIAAAGFIDRYLKELVTISLHGLTNEVKEKLLGSGSPLATLRARIDVAKALDLLDGDERRDAIQIARVRNRIVHQLGEVSFEDPAIRELIAKMAGLGGRYGQPPDAESARGEINRDKFCYVAAGLAAEIAEKLGRELSVGCEPLSTR